MNARLDLDADHTVRLDLDVDRTARLGLAKRTVMPSVLRRRPGRQRDILLREALRVRSGDAVARRGGPVDSTVRLGLDVDRTARLGLAKWAVRPLAPPRPPGPQSALHQTLSAYGHGPEVVRRTRQADNSRRSRLNPSIPILGILLILTATLRLINLTGSPARLDDEGTYMAQAYAVAEWGELAHYTYWYDHPPAGWLQLALWTAISGPDFGGNAVAAGRYLMVIVAVITAALLWVLARRIEMSRWASAAAVAIFALSPLAISLSRTVYLDNLATAWVLGALVLLCSPRYRLSAMFGAATCFGIAVLTKETMLLLLPMFAWLVWTRTAPVTRRYALAVFVAVFGVVVSTYVLMAVLRGELVPGPGHVSLWDGIRFQLWERTAGGDAR